jgi:2-polyprenyl-3-methyl-5-hydroxy-6-metoxy-1,4-benzoquinol methylase
MAWAGRRVLEVGCGAGGILNHFRQIGAEVKGCDLGSEYLQYGATRHGLDLVHGPIDAVSDIEKFDLIIYSHVFEHLLHPRAELLKIARRLAPQGVLYIEVPGIHNIRRQYRCDFLRLLQHAHVLHFTLTTLNKLLEQGGFAMRKGTEYVQAIYEITPNSDSDASDEFPRIVDSLRRYEKLRPISRYLPDNLFRVIRLNLRRVLTSV